MSKYYPPHRPARADARYDDADDRDYYDPEMAEPRQRSHLGGQHPPSEYPSNSYAPPPTRSQYDEYTPRDESRPVESNQLAPYDEEKAYAEYYRGLAQENNYDRPSPSEHSRQYDSRQSYDDRYDSRPAYDARYDRSAAPYDESERHRHRYDDARLPAESRGGERDGERDLGAALIGGAGGALIGHKMLGHGTLGAIGGAIAGAVSANAFEHYEEKRKLEKEDRRRQKLEGPLDSYNDARRSHPASRYDDEPYGSSVAGGMYSDGPSTSHGGRDHERHQARHRRGRTDDGYSSGD